MTVQTVQSKPSQNLTVQTVQSKPSQNLTVQTVQSKPSQNLTVQTVQSKPSQNLTVQTVQSKPSQNLTVQTVQSKPSQNLTVQTVQSKPSHSSVKTIPKLNTDAPARPHVTNLAAKVIPCEKLSYGQLPHGIMGDKIVPNQPSNMERSMMFPWSPRPAVMHSTRTVHGKHQFWCGNCDHLKLKPITLVLYI